MTTTPRLVTAAEFEAMPDSHPGKTELWYGEVVRMAPVGEQHGDGAMAVGSPLRAFAREHKLGVVGPEIGYWLNRDPDLLLAPDMSFSAEGRAGATRLRGFVIGPPTLAVEIVSPSETGAEIQRKVDTYLSHGTARVWYVYPEQQVVIVHRPDNTSHTFRLADTLTSDDAGFTVEGFALPLADLFHDE